MARLNPTLPHHGGVVYVVTPWKDAAELLDVRNRLYGELSGMEDRKRAVGMINAWEMRGKIPHAMQSTAMLMAARIHHEVPDSMPFSVQATYATAISRFISGYCDISMANQQRRSMHNEAARLGIPASWVDVRHDAIHGSKLPGVTLLASVAKEALKWLWNDYWHDLESQLNDNTLSPLINREFSGEGLRTCLDTFRKERTLEHKMGADPTLLRLASSKLVVSLIEQCDDQEGRLESLIRILLEPGMLVPRNIGEIENADPLLGAHILWDVALLALSRHQSGFLPLLLSRMTATLIELGIVERDNNYVNAIHLWILHALKHFSGSHAPWEKLTNQVLSDCVSVPSEWSIKLSRQLMESDRSLKEVWDPYISMEEAEVGYGSQVGLVV